MKLGNCTEDCFILSTFVIAKPDGSMKLALNSNIKKTDLRESLSDAQNE